MTKKCLSVIRKVCVIECYDAVMLRCHDVTVCYGVQSDTK